YLGFVLISAHVVFETCDLIAEHIPSLRALLSGSDYWTNLPFVAIVGAYIFVVFGFLSRRCERQADLYGCRAVSCTGGDCLGHESGRPLSEGGQALCPTRIRTFIEALE